MLSENQGAKDFLHTLVFKEFGFTIKQKALQYLEKCFSMSKGLAEFAAIAANKIPIIFTGKARRDSPADKSAPKFGSASAVWKC